MSKRIFLSPPFIGAAERRAVESAFDSKYIAPCGPDVERFERKLAGIAGRRHAVAVSSGTAALDLIMHCLGVDGTWTVFAPTLTFVASVGPAYHRGAKLVFVDCDEQGLVDVALLGKALKACKSRRKLILGVDLYGNCCNYNALEALSAAYGAKLVIDSAEAVGATLDGRPAGSAGIAAIYSFNGNKIVTTSSGGAVLTDDPGLAARAAKLAQQSREPVLWYEHREVGYNYRLSNILAAIGCAQLGRLGQILEKRRRLYRHYLEVGGKYLRHSPSGNHWLTVRLCGGEEERNRLIGEFDRAGIEVRPVWKPMHLQPVFAGCQVAGGKVAERLFRTGLCLPSGTGLKKNDLKRIDEVLLNMV